MNDAATRPERVVLERQYEARVEDLWELWTTKEGFSSWWGPEGFRVEVHAFDLRVGGELSYDMIAVGAEQIAAMKRMGMPVSHGTHGRFAEIVTLKRLRLTHVIDFIAGQEPYEHDLLVEFAQDGSTARMTITIDPNATEELTRMSVAGMESQLTKVPAALKRSAGR
jgi:uncharacterized protein YndB with AHSA1/START domain